jgi:hypothetical protein
MSHGTCVDLKFSCIPDLQRMKFRLPQNRINLYHFFTTEKFNRRNIVIVCLPYWVDCVWFRSFPEEGGQVSEFRRLDQRADGFLGGAEGDDAGQVGIAQGPRETPALPQELLLVAVGTASPQGLDYD